jgi:multidrug efflux pump subunit AcrA (membrane-fusion protein)
MKSPRVSRGRLLTAVAITFTLLATPTLALYAQGPGGGGPPPAPVAAARVIEQQLKINRTFVGTIKPLRSSTVASSVEELVVQFLVNEGDYVTAQTPLAILRTRQLEIQLDAARAEERLRTEELKELENGSRDEEIRQAESRVAASKALLKYAKDAHQRIKKMAEQDALSQDELEDAFAAMEAATARHDENVAALELVQAGPREEEIAQAAARLETQKNNVAQLEDLIQQHTICAPFDGYIVREHTEEGQWVAKGGPVVEMIEIGRVDLEVPVLETYIPHLRVGTEGTVEVEAYPEEEFPGTVALIVPKADEQARSFPVKIRLDNVAEDSAPESASAEGAPAANPISPVMKFKPGMFARVHLPVGEEAVTLVPKDALVLEKRDEKYVCVIQLPEDSSEPGVGTARKLRVDVGVAYDEYIEVHGDLRQGDLVVTEGNERLTKERKVRIINLADVDEGDSASQLRPAGMSAKSRNAAPAAR